MDIKSWQSIASDKQASLIHDCLPKIVDIVVRMVDENDLSLTAGICGKLVFLHECRKHYDALIPEHQIEKIARQLLNNAANYPFDHSIARGLSGLGWTLDYLGYSDNSDFNSDINECLLEILSVANWNGEYEFLYGLTGIGTYGACRLDKPDGETIARKVVEHLIALSTETAEGTYWETRPNSLFFQKDMPSPQQNLGTAHGNCSVMGLLIKLVENNLMPDVSKSLLKDLCRWFVSQKLDPDKSGGGYFPAISGNPNTSRMGWCYGDLTTSLLLLRAGHILDDLTLFEFGEQVAQLSTLRTIENGSVDDAALCHGSGGISLIYQHIGRFTQADEIHQAAQKWLQVTLDKASIHPDLSGLLQNLEKLPEDVRKAYKHGDFLMGYAGVGLSLIAATTDDFPGWGASLLLS